MCVAENIAKRGVLRRRLAENLAKRGVWRTCAAENIAFRDESARSARAAGRADQASPAAEAYTQAAAARLVHQGRSRPQQETPRSARV